METIILPEIKTVLEGTIRSIIPTFRDPSTMSREQLTDPDFRLKSLQKEYGGEFDITCSKCHHCR